MKEKVVLKSTHPEEYPDLVIECVFLSAEQIGEYLKGKKSFYATKKAQVSAKFGVPGEQIRTTLKVVVDGNEYVLKEENGVVKEREYEREDGTTVLLPDVVVKNVNSTSDEEYVVKAGNFARTYSGPEVKTEWQSYVPVPEERLFTEVDEDVVFMTSWGEKVVCLKGSYIVFYGVGDYNAVERDAFNATYKVTGEYVPGITRKRKI